MRRAVLLVLGVLLLAVLIVLSARAVSPPPAVVWGEHDQPAASLTVDHGPGSPPPIAERSPVAAAPGTPMPAPPDGNGEIAVELRWEDDHAPVAGHEVVATARWSAGPLLRMTLR